jgi:hypothetical protein
LHKTVTKKHRRKSERKISEEGFQHLLKKIFDNVENVSAECQPFFFSINSAAASKDLNHSSPNLRVNAVSRKRTPGTFSSSPSLQAGYKYSTYRS